jgi:hypothetical protein
MTSIIVKFTPKEVDALWTAANTGRNDFLFDPIAARLYSGSRAGIANANRAIDKLAKASRGKINLKPVSAPDLEQWIEKQLCRKFPPIPRKYRAS